MTNKTVTTTIVAIVRQMTRRRVALSWERLTSRRDHDDVHVALLVLTTLGIVRTTKLGDYELADEYAGLWPTTRMARLWVDQYRRHEH